MLRHVVMLRWADGVDASAAGDGLTEALTELPDAIVQIRTYSFGPDARVNAGNFDYVVVADFDSADDYVVYRDHLAHLQLIERHIAPLVGERSAVQYETS